MDKIWKNIHIGVKNMYYEAKKVRKKEHLIIIIFMSATTVLLWMLMIKLDKTENTKFETNYNASKVSTKHEENVEKQPENTIEKASKKIVGISKMENTSMWLFDAKDDFIGIGSGVIVSDNGYILTNEHVAGSKYSNVYVTLENGMKYNSTVVWADKDLDLAIVKISAENLDYMRLGDSDNIKLGEGVYAIGNPIGFEFQRTVTKGIISGINRTIKINEQDSESYMEDLIQTDATINDGNSGGALINEAGELLGINTVKINDAESIGFAIPINIVKPVLDKLINSGEVNDLRLGIYALDKEALPYLDSNLDIKSGIYVVSIQNDSILKDKLRVGDIIESIDETDINKMNEVRKIIWSKNKGDRVVLKVKRGLEYLNLEVELK